MKSVRTRTTPVHSWVSPVGVPPSTIVERSRAEPLDLLLVLLVTLLASVAVLVEAPVPLRAGLGLLLVLFCPGYALTSALFPTQDGPDGTERIALGFGLSLALIPLVALAIDYSPWSLTTTPLVAALSGVSLAASVCSYMRRRRLPESERYRIRAVLPSYASPRAWDRPTRFAVGLAVVALVLLGAGGAPIIANRINGDALTEFALYNETGDPQFYPRRITVGEPATVNLSITNHEGVPMSYTLVVTGAGVPVDRVTRVTLDDGETWNGPILFTVVEVGEGLPVRFEIRRTDRSDDYEPYRVLQLVVDGVGPIVDQAD